MARDTTFKQRNLVAAEVLCYLLDRDQQLARRIAAMAGEISHESGTVSEEEVLQFLDPWVKYVPRR